MIEWLVLGYFVFAFGGFLIGLNYGESHDLFASLTFGLLWPLLVVVWVLRKI